MDKPRWPWQQESTAPTTSADLLDPATKQTLDALLAIQMRLELATGVPVAIYGPSGQQLPGISPTLTRTSEHHVPPAREVLAADQWPQRAGHLLAVTWGQNLHFFITPIVLLDHPVAQVVLGPLHLFDPGQQDGLASERAALPRAKTVVGVPVLSSWRAHAVAEIATVIVSLYCNQKSIETEHRRQAVRLPAAQEETTTGLPASEHTGQHTRARQPAPPRQYDPDRRRPEEGVTRLGSLAESARLAEREERGNSAGLAPHALTTLQERLKLLGNLVEGLPQAILICAAPGGQIILANRAARAFWPAALGEPAGAGAASAKRISLEDYPPAWSGLSQALRQGVVLRQREISIARPTQPESEQAAAVLQRLSGSIADEYSEAATAPATPTPPVTADEAFSQSTPRLPLLVSSFPLRDASGKISHAVAIFEDVSSLLEREAWKDALVLHAAHDARNPLTVISSAAQLLERALTREASQGASGRERERRWLADIHEQVRLLTNHTEHLALLVHLQQAGHAPQSEPCNLARLVQQAVVDQHIHTPERRIEATLESNPCIIQGSPLQVQHILAHLLKNAVISSRPETLIRVSLRCPPEHAPLWAEVSVCDQGVGIPQASLPHLFERFYQVPETSQRRLLRAQASSPQNDLDPGLSLYLCKQLIEQLGGQIWVESEEGQGTTVKLRLPLKQ